MNAQDMRHSAIKIQCRLQRIEQIGEFETDMLDLDVGLTNFEASAIQDCIERFEDLGFDVVGWNDMYIHVVDMWGDRFRIEFHDDAISAFLEGY